MVEHVRPQHDASAMLRSQISQTQDVLQIHATLAEALAQLPGLASGEVPGLVAIDVQPPRAEVGQEVRVQLLQELVRFFARRRETPAPADLVQMGVARHRQHVTLMAE